jgi:retron-type reverse transcriptase
MEKIGTAADFFRKVKNTYNRTVTCVKTNKKQSAWSQTRSGVRQGSVLSPILFNIIINYICKKIKETGLKAFTYADNIMIWSDNKKHLKPIGKEKASITAYR